MAGYIGSKRSSSLVSTKGITLEEIKLAASGDSITKSDGTTAVLSESAGVVTLTADEANVGSNALVVDASGEVLIGTTTATNNLRLGQKLSVVNVGANYGGASFTSYPGASPGLHSFIDFQRSRGSTDGSMTGVASGDVLGAVVFRGSDGSSFRDSVVISAEVDGATGPSDMPGRLLFKTSSDSSASATERMRIDSNGLIRFGTSLRTRIGTAYFADDSANGNNAGIVLGGGPALLPANGNGSLTDGVMDLGKSNVRWQDIYATNSTIQTSDRNEKRDIEELTEAEQRVAVACKGLLRKFRWKNAVAKKGDEARIHFGIIAQDLQAAFEAEGLDAGRYGMFMSNTWWETSETYTDDEGVEQTRTNTYDTAEEAPEGAVERTRLGIRYSELLAFIIAAI